MGISERLYEELRYLFEVKGDKDPLTEEPISNNKLFCTVKGFDTYFFNTKEERDNFIFSNQLSSYRNLTFEYIGEIAGKSNVIKETNECHCYRLLSMLDEGKYQVYNHERSTMKADFIWDNYYGNITPLYNAFEQKTVKQKTKSI